MKYIPLALTLAITGFAPASAVTLDSQAFGASLNGWRKDRTAVYDINNNSYRTHQPTATRTKGGGLFVSTRIEEGSRSSKRAVCFLELTFTPEGHLVGAQIRATLEGKRLDTGLVTRAAELPAPVVDEGGAKPTKAWETPTSRLVNELFSRFDTELNKLDVKDDDKPKRRDIFGRLSASNKGKDIPAAVRHNLNLLLASVGSGRGVSYK